MQGPAAQLSDIAAMGSEPSGSHFRPSLPHIRGMDKRSPPNPQAVPVAAMGGVVRTPLGAGAGAEATGVQPAASEAADRQLQDTEPIALDTVLRLAPCPALAIDPRGEIIRTSDELAAEAPPLGAVAATGRLRALWPLYRRALSGDPPWLTPQVAAITRTGEAGQSVHEQLVLRRSDWGACLFVIDQTELRTLQVGNMQTTRLAALGFMVAGVSHELSNPLTSVHSVVQLLRSQPPQSEDVLRKGLETIGSDIRRILEISRRLLTFSRVGDEPRTPLPIAVAIDEALACARADGMFHQIKVTVSHDTGAEVLGNVGQLRQVFSNVFQNAAQAMGGAGHLVVRTTRTTKGRVGVAISDSGPGIPAEIAPKVFQAFFTTKRSGDGTGLGLAISQQIVSEHGGRIWFENNRDGGTTFWVDLPEVRR
jgi:signal transduction histidine kinase